MFPTQTTAAAGKIKPVLGKAQGVGSAGVLKPLLSSAWACDTQRFLCFQI